MYLRLFRVFSFSSDFYIENKSNYKSTPTSGLQAILGIEDFDILTDRLGMQTAMRIGPPEPEWDGNLL